jgi:4-amino-4-deoxy-L-arabinose transferase-like glycosyltransferase
VDESYMVASGRVLSLGYYDHPPAAWWLSWGVAHLTGSEAPIVVRLPFIALFALSTWLMYRLGTAVSDERGGLWAAVLLNLSPVFGVTTGTWVLPDGPLDCALLGAALCLMRALERGTLAWWLATGLCAGLALFSKYSAVLTIGGAFVYLLSSAQHRQWLSRSKPWIAILVALLVFSPVLIWNAGHGWASFAFQGDRAAGSHLRPFAPLITLGGEALFVLPWIWLPMMAVFVAAIRRGPGEWRSWLLCCLAAPPILVFALISAWSSQRVLFHWAAPGYLMLFPLLGDAVARRLDQPRVRRALYGTAAFVVLAVAVVATQVRFDWLHAAIAGTARRDPTIEAIDWTSLRDELTARGVLHPGSVIGVPNWRDAGKIAYALGPDVTTLCLNRDSRQFGIAAPVSAFNGADVLILAPEHGDRVPAELGGVFDSVDVMPDASIRHAGRILQSVAVFQGHRLRHWPPSG